MTSDNLTKGYASCYCFMRALAESTRLRDIEDLAFEMSLYDNRHSCDPAATHNWLKLHSETGFSLEPWSVFERCVRFVEIEYGGPHTTIGDLISELDAVASAKDETSKYWQLFRGSVDRFRNEVEDWSALELHR